VVLFIRLYKLKVALSCKSVDYIIQMKAIEQYYNVVLSISLYKVVLTFKAFKSLK